MKNKRMLINALSSMASYGLILVLGMVSAKYILVGYGSAANGLISSVNHIFSYIALLEAGIGTATISALYRPVARNSQAEIGAVLAASRQYYRAWARGYMLLVAAAAFVWPLMIKTDIAHLTVSGVVFFQGVSGVMTYWYISAATNYLVASGRNYVNNGVHLAAAVLTCALKICICMAELNIVWLSVSMVCVNGVKCLFYSLYMKKACPAFAYAGQADQSLIRQRNSFLVHEISGVVFSSTDTILLAVFSSLSDASVYAVYAMVFGALRQIVGQVFSGTNYILGNRYAKDREGYAGAHDRYNAVYICIVFAVFTAAYGLVMPFLSLYTRGVTDANYMDPKLAWLFVLIELLSACRVVDNQLIKIALHADRTAARAVAEAAVNLIVSLIGVRYLGIYGVLLGTITALIYRTNDIILYANRRILGRRPLKAYALYFVNFAVFALLAALGPRLDIAAASYLQLFGMAVLYGAALLAVYALANLAAHRVLTKIG